MQPLKNKIALVAGATRGAGRGIACMLGEAGATVYCTGRSTINNPSSMKRPEMIEETARLVDRWGGKGIPVRVDHTEEEEVKRLIDKISRENGKLDILINDVWGGDRLTEWGKPFWELNLEKGYKMIRRAIYSHLITSKYAVPLMMKNNGIIIEITDGDNYYYRGNLFYDLVKTSIIRIAFIMARELRTKGVMAIAVTPGFLRSEAMLDHFGVTEENWQEGTEKDRDFIASETPFFVGRCIASLCSDGKLAQKNGRVFSSWDLAEEYGIDDVDGNRPHWGNYFEKTYNYKGENCNDRFYEFWKNGPIEVIMSDWP